MQVRDGRAAAAQTMNIGEHFGKNILDNSTQNGYI